MKLENPQHRTLHYNYSPEPARRLDYNPDACVGGGRFDRLEQEELHKMFKDFIFLERELESAKVELSLKPDFNLLDAFKMIDLNNSGALNL